jgi:hypothetical protein
MLVMVLMTFGNRDTALGGGRKKRGAQCEDGADTMKRITNLTL